MLPKVGISTGSTNNRATTVEGPSNISFHDLRNGLAQILVDLDNQTSGGSRICGF